MFDPTRRGFLRALGAVCGVGLAAAAGVPLPKLPRPPTRAFFPSGIPPSVLGCICTPCPGAPNSLHGGPVTLVDVAKWQGRHDACPVHGGGAALVAEILTERNLMLEDVRWIEGSLPTFRSTIKPPPWPSTFDGEPH